MRAQLASVDDDSSVAILAYSAGMLIVYNWLAARATETEVQRLSAIVCIAGPYRFQQPEQTIYFAHKPELTIDVREDNIAPTRIAQYLRPKQLVVLRASNDITVLEANASFRGHRVANVIDEQVIDGAHHHTICRDPATLSYLRQRLIALGETATADPR